MESIVLRKNSSERNYWRDLWRYRELFYVLAWRDVSVRYKQTAIGVLWAVVQPLVTLIVFTFVFGRVANLPSDGGVPYVVMVCAGLLPWQFFSAAFVNSSASIVGNAALVTKVYFPRIIIPGASIVVAAVDFLIGITIMLALLFYYGYTPSLSSLYLVPLCFAMAALFSMGAGLIMAALNVKYRDIRYVIPFLVQIGLYVSPVGFSVSLVPEQYRWAYFLNPMVSVIEGFRASFIPGVSIDISGLVTGMVVTMLTVFIGVRVFRLTEKSFADTI